MFCEHLWMCDARRTIKKGIDAWLLLWLPLLLVVACVLCVRACDGKWLTSGYHCLMESFCADRTIADRLFERNATQQSTMQPTNETKSHWQRERAAALESANIMPSTMTTITAATIAAPSDGTIKTTMTMRRPRSLSSLSVCIIVGCAVLRSADGFVNPTPMVSKIPEGTANPSSAAARSTSSSSVFRLPPLTNVVNSGVEDLYSTLPRGAKNEPSSNKSAFSSAKALVSTPPASSEPNTSVQGSPGQALLSSLAVMLAMIPHSLAFAYVAGATPLAGLWTTVIVGFVASALGARPGMCSATSGACAMVVGMLGKTYGPSYLSACAILSGLLQIFGGAVRLGRLVRLFPYPVMLGFVNGLAILMAKVQLIHFREGSKYMSLFSKTGASMYGIVALTMAIVKFLPKVTKAVPASVGAVIISTLLAKVLGLPLQTLADVAGSSSVATGLAAVPSESFFSSLAGAGSSIVYGITALAVTTVKMLPIGIQALPVSIGAMALSAFVPKDMLGNVPAATAVPKALATFAGGKAILPSFGLPDIPMTWGTLRILLPYAMTMAAAGSIKSLLTLQLVDGMVDDGERGSPDKECVAQGLGNVASGLFGGIGGSAVVGETILNIEGGGASTRLSGMFISLLLGLGIFAAGPLIGSIPVASLVGIMLLVSQKTFSWSSLRLLNKIPKMDAFVIALVSIISVRRDLAQAVLAGTVASAMSFAWKQSTTLNTYSLVRDQTKLYKLSGPLFFGSIDQFLGLFPNKADDPQIVVLDFANSRVMDHSALDAIYNLSSQYAATGKEVFLRHLSPDAANLLRKFQMETGRKLPYEIMVDPENDPIYGFGGKITKEE